MTLLRIARPGITPAGCRNTFRFLCVAAVWLAVLPVSVSLADPARDPGAEPFLTKQDIFEPEHWHNHGSCIVETPDGGFIACWFHGSGERTADDVRIEGARLSPGAAAWSGRFVMADTPGYPDTNCCMFVDPSGRLWLLWPVILANTWESALMKYRISSRYGGPGAPEWDVNEIMHVTPGPEFDRAVDRYADSLLAEADGPEAKREAGEWVEAVRKRAADRLSRRLGWFTRAHPVVLDGRRLIVPLYSDGFSFSLMNISDDWGETWRTSEPLPGPGNVQPSLVRRKDGSLHALMRDNGPPPKRLLQSESRDGGLTWSPVTDSEHPNPGSGAEVISLRNGRWLLIGNDTESGRHRLAVSLSEDEGRTWKWKRYLEEAPPGTARYHYPSVIEASDGTIHATYSHHMESGAPADAAGRPRAKTIRHARFNQAWLTAGEP